MEFRITERDGEQVGWRRVPVYSLMLPKTALLSPDEKISIGSDGYNEWRQGSNRGHI